MASIQELARGDRADVVPQAGEGAARDDVFRRLDQLNDIGAALSFEKDLNALLERIVIAAKTITRADGGTLYLVEGADMHRRLRFAIMQTASLRHVHGRHHRSADPVRADRSSTLATHRTIP